MAAPDRAARRRRLPRARPRPARLRPLDRARATSRRTASTTSPATCSALLDATGHDDAVFVGHDWGALVVWDLARLHPERVRAVVGVSVPYTQWPAPPTDLFKTASGDRFFYILYFQQVGPAETELDADVDRDDAQDAVGGVRRGHPDDPARAPPMEGTGFLDIDEPRGPIPPAAGLAHPGRPRRLRRAVRDQRVLRAGQLVPQPRRQLRARSRTSRRRRCRASFIGGPRTGSSPTAPATSRRWRPAARLQGHV